MLFVRSDITAKLLSVDIGFEIFFVELNSRKKEMATKLFLYFHVITIKVVESHLNCLSRSIDAHSSKYENIILLGDFHSSMLDSSMKAFCETYKIP